MKRWVLGALAGVAVLFVLGALALQVLMSQVPQRGAEIRAWVNRSSGLDLRLSRLNARWSLTGPELYATDVEVYAPQGGARLARAREVTIAANLWHMVSRLEGLSGRVRVIAPEVRLVRTAEGKIALEGRPRDRQDKPLDADALPNGSLEIVDGRVTLTEAGGELLKLAGLTFRLERHREAVGFSGALNLPSALGAALKFGGAIRGPLDRPAALRWEVKVTGRDLHLAAWRGVFGGRWLAFDPRGDVRTLTFGFFKQPGRGSAFTVAARFAGVGFESVGKIPGLRGLDGEVEASETAGVARLSSSSFVFLMPRSFREPLRADAVKGEVNWRREEGWKIASRQFLVRNPHGRFTTDLDLTLPADGGSPLLKLRSRFQDVAITEGWRYLPADRLGAKTIEWLDKAFLAGRVPAGEFVFDGPTRKFPFRDGGGEFRVSFPVEGLRLHYGQGWPELEDVALDVEFRNAGLTGTVRSGRLNGLAIAAGSTARFVDFKTGELTVQGQASGDAGAALGYVQGSPLGLKLGGAFMRLRGQGAVEAGIDLLLPVKHLDDRKVGIDVKFDRAQVALVDSSHELRDLSGALRIDNKQLTASNLTATYLGGPMSIDMSVRGAGVEKTQVIRVRAQTSGAALSGALGAPAMVGLGGVVDWRGSVRVPIDAGMKTTRSVSVRIDSGLRGAEVGSPAPLKKKAGETRPLRIDVQWPEASRAAVRVSYGAAHSRLELSARGDDNGSESAAAHEVSEEKGNESREREADAGLGKVGSGGWRLVRGAVRLGEGEARLPADEGLYIEGAVDAFDLSEWLALRSDKPGGRPLSSYLRGVELSVRDFSLYGFHFSDVKGRMAPGERAWNITVNAPQARGSVRVPFELQGPEPLTLDLEKLTLEWPGGSEAGDPAGQPVKAGGAKAEGDVDPRKWPAVTASVADFTAWNKHFGALQARLARVPEGLELVSLQARQSSFSLTGSGAWTVAAESREPAQRSRLALRLESTDVLKTLQELGYGASLTGKQGLATMNLEWPGAPDGRLLGRLSGTMSIAVENGQLVGVQPGAGRVFGLMSVAMLRRRLALDFSDLTEKGLAFDTVAGNFELKSGNAYTSNLLLKGPAAEIGIVGRTGLEARDYDQTVVVTGNLGQSLPMAGALAGGPAVGAALLVFSQIFKQPLKGIARGYYRITGSWDEPAVQKIEASELTPELKQELKNEPKG